MKEIQLTIIRLLFWGETEILKKCQYLTRFLLVKKLYFIGYLHHGNQVKPLNIMLSKTSAYVKSYDEKTEWMYFLIEDDDLLEKCNNIWNKVSVDIKKEFDREPV